ncbi:MFS transporter multidrug-resistance type transporter [Orobanche minor]
MRFIVLCISLSVVLRKYFFVAQILQETGLGSSNMVYLVLGTDNISISTRLLQRSINWLLSMNGQRLVPVGLGDADQCIEDDFSAWRDLVCPELNKIFRGEDDATVSTSYAAAVLEYHVVFHDQSGNSVLDKSSANSYANGNAVHDAQHPCRGEFCCNGRASRPATDRSCTHLEFDISGTGLAYSALIALAAYASDPSEANRLKHLASRTGKNLLVIPSFDALRTSDSSSKVFHLLLLTFGYSMGGLQDFFLERCLDAVAGATIVDQVVIIAPAANYVPEPRIREIRIVDNAMSMSQDIPLQLLRYSLFRRHGKMNAVNKAKAFDEKHRLTANASARVVSFDKRVGLTEKFPVGISVVNEKVKSVDKKFQVCDKTMSAIMVAERKINDTDQLLNLAGTSDNLYSVQAQASNLVSSWNVYSLNCTDPFETDSCLIYAWVLD